MSDNAKTTELYASGKFAQNVKGALPERFDNPECFKGYGQKNEHPLYQTSSADYGALPPSVHTMPTHYHGRDGQFTQHLGNAGMYRNHSLNTAVDMSKTHKTKDGLI